MVPPWDADQGCVSLLSPNILIFRRSLLSPNVPLHPLFLSDTLRACLNPYLWVSLLVSPHFYRSKNLSLLQAVALSLDKDKFSTLDTQRGEVRHRMSPRDSERGKMKNLMVPGREGTGF